MLTKMNLSPIDFNQTQDKHTIFSKKEFCSPLQQFSILHTPKQTKPIPELSTESWIFSAKDYKKRSIKYNQFNLFQNDVIIQKGYRSQSQGTYKKKSSDTSQSIKDLLIQKNQELKLKQESLIKKYNRNLKNQIVKDSRLYSLEEDNKQLLKENNYLKGSTIYMEKKFEEYLNQNSILKKQLENSVHKKILRSFFKQFMKKECTLKTKNQIMEVFNALLDEKY